MSADDTKKHILIIDDDLSSVELLRDRLAAAGFRVSTADDGKDGLEKVQKMLPDLVILDLLLPKLDGFRLCELMKKNSKTSKIPILVLTAVFVEDFDRRKAIRIGADSYMLKAEGYLSKPCDHERLLASVRRLLGQEQEGEQPAKGITIFAVDDDPDVLDLIQAGLQVGGYNVVPFTNPQEALKQLAQIKPQLVLLDLKFPEANGLDILAQIRQVNPDLPVVMLTGYVTQQTALEAIHRGANDYIVKPVVHRELRLRVGEIVEKQRLRQERDLLITALKHSNIQLMRRYEGAEKLLENLQETQDELIRSEKLHALGVLSSGAAHELNNPLAGILGNAQNMEMVLEQKSLSEEDRKVLSEALADIQKDVKRCMKIVNSLMEFSRRGPSQRKHMDIANVLEEAVATAQKILAFDQVKILRNIPNHMPQVLGDPDQIGQVFMNLLVNAWHAMPSGGELSLDIKHVEGKGNGPDGSSNGSILVSISDTGEGITSTDLGKIFDPFFTTRPLGKGSGLGLYVSYHIVQRHGGKLEAFSKGKGKGARFVVTLPVAGA